MKEERGKRKEVEVGSGGWESVRERSTVYVCACIYT